jgi:hypothetical protein
VTVTGGGVSGITTGLRLELLGYRPVRDPDGDGVRLELAQEAGRSVVHNYGHGGAGITLSWGCVLRVARILDDRLAGTGTHTDWSGPESVMTHVRSEVADRVGPR